jgi:uroporphyrin-III C-methyltransferase
MGKVYLIGAGPGAADLITVRGARLLGTADVVLHDALIEPAMLEHAPHARKIAVGKRCGQRSTAQHFINKQIVDAARTHDVVVRLKGGDPMLFGRADEEMRALEEAGIDYEVVPGITAALAAASSVKRSLTLRGVARSVALATKSRAPDTEAIREAVNADSLVFYMGRDSAPDIAQQLIDAGRSGATPVAIVEACSTPRERTLTLTLEALAMGEAQVWLDPSQPSLLMIGEAFAERARATTEQENAGRAEASAAFAHAA